MEDQRLCWPSEGEMLDNKQTGGEPEAPGPVYPSGFLHADGGNPLGGGLGTPSFSPCTFPLLFSSYSCSLTPTPLSCVSHSPETPRWACLPH